MASAGHVQDRPAGGSPPPAFLAQIAGFPMIAADLPPPAPG
jgi:hypothetical protein